MLLLTSLTLLPLSIVAFVPFSEFWIFLVVAFLAMKFGGFGCGGCCHRSKLKEPNPSPEQKQLYDEEDIVPDGQSGF